jgi:YidC/Oxa1 family membrane protein insertase
MDKRTLTALLLMLIVFLVFNQFVWKPQQLARQKQTQAKTSKQEQPQATSKATVAQDTLVSAPFADSLLSGAEKPETIKLSNELMSVSFSSLGATVTRVDLANYKMHDGRPVSLIPDGQNLAATKLLHNGSDTPLQQAVFKYSLAPDSKSITFYLGDQDKPQVKKSFSLDSRYGIAMTVDVSGYKPLNGLEVDFGSGIADTERTTKSKSMDYKFIYYADNEIHKVALSKFKKSQPAGSFSSFNWMALRSKYFTLALKETEPSLMRNYSAGVNSETGNPTFSINSRQANVKQSWSQSFVIYAGPNDYTILKDYGKQMDSIPERGVSWLRWLSNIFAWLLKFLHRYIKNYGVVLLVFAVLMKLLLHPLTHKQMEHGLKQQKLQPYLEEIRKKYPNDMRKQQEEMKALYKEHNTSMGAGCLPILIQMPIIIPLYNVLRYSLDMRNASFVGWLKDLSEPDPYLVLPIIMGLFMIVQSLMMRPPKTDESKLTEQQKMQQQQMKMMTWLMPVMMFFIFKGMPAGLVLYWTAFNILSVIHQYYLNKHFKNKENQ